MSKTGWQEELGFLAKSQRREPIKHREEMSLETARKFRGCDHPTISIETLLMLMETAYPGCTWRVGDDCFILVKHDQKEIEIDLQINFCNS